MKMSDRVKQIHAVIREAGITTRPELMEKLQLKEGSMMKVIRESKVISSINHNSRFYTLSELVDFDENGLWEKDGIRFSREGTLTGTVVAFVHRSPAGMTGDAIRSALGASTLSSLANLYRKKRISRRQSEEGFIYLSADAKRRAEQETEIQRRSLLDSNGLPDQKLIIALLTTLIECPHISKEKLLQQLQNKELMMTMEMIDNIWSHYDLEKKGNERRSPRTDNSSV